MKTTSLGPSALALLAFAAAAFAATAPWPQLHGPRRDNQSTETGLLEQWPDGGPKLAWAFAECGRGFAGISVADGRIYISGDFGSEEFVLALDLDGKLLWKTPNGKAWRGPYPGARTTPTWDDGVLYHMNPHGRLAALDAATGRELWALDLKSTYDAKTSRWAFAENILVDGPVLYAAPGGTKGRVVALDKATGKPVLANTEITDRAAYCSPILIDHNGRRLLVTILQEVIVALDPKTGKLLWSHHHTTQHDQNVTHPLYHQGLLYASSGHGTGGRLLKLSPDGTSVAELWVNKDLDNCHGGVLLVGGHVYGSGCRLFRKGLVCVDFATGKTAWSDPRFGPLSLTGAQGMIYAVDRQGRATLFRASAERSNVVSQFQVPRRNRSAFLSHPVICGGRLYIRHTDTLYAYDISASPAK
ncbi:PQQ-binding-like beta-propeller repeat protein [bacterium]|nr:PQQ-binding-like beta-propeller repeat protein [bacterium]